MAITLTLTQSDTLVSNGQSSNFMLTVTNTDGAARAVKSVGFTPPPGGTLGGLNAAINLDLPDDASIADSASLVLPFSGTFYAQGSNLVGGATSVTLPFVARVAMTDSLGAPTSNEVSSTVSMSVVPSDGARGSNTFGYGLIDLESNDSTALALVLGLI